MIEAGSLVAQRRAAFFGAAACVWALVFAAISFYWAMGGRAGTETLGPAITGLAQDPTFIAFVWVTAILKVLLGLLALALIRLPENRILRRLLLASGWAAGIGMVLYGGASFVQHALMLTGAVRLPAGLGETAAFWHLLLWDPFWMLGGLLFIVTTWYAGRMKRRSVERGDEGHLRF